MFKEGDMVKYTGVESTPFRPRYRAMPGTIISTKDYGSKEGTGYQVIWDDDNTWWHVESQLKLYEAKSTAKVVTDSIL